MKSVKLTKKQLAILKGYSAKEQGIKMGLEALSESLREATKDTWKYAKSIEPKAIIIDWEKGCLSLDE